MGDLEKDPNDVPTEEQAFLLSPTPAPQKSKRDLVAELPQFALVDVDTIRIDQRIEKYLHEAGINSIFTPSLGVLTQKSLPELAIQEPIQIVRCAGSWACLANEPLIAEAKRILAPPRFLPVVIRKDANKVDLRNIAIVEQIIRPARNQMDNASLKARVPMLLRCAELTPELIAQGLRDDRWADILRRSLRWFAGAKKKVTHKKDGADGK